MLTAERIIGIMILAYGSMQDLRTKSITKIYTWIAIMLTFVFSVFIRRTEIIDCMAGLAEGIIMVIFSRLSGGILGEGDGRIFCCVGLLTGAYGGVQILFWSVIFAAIFSMGLLLTKRGTKKSTIPFLPFLMAGFMVYEIVGGRT